jgi:hypothetical protein
LNKINPTVSVKHSRRMISEVSVNHLMALVFDTLLSKDIRRLVLNTINPTVSVQHVIVWVSVEHVNVKLYSDRKIS